MASDFILEIDGIKGESKVKGMVDKIDLQSWSCGVTNSGSFAGGGGGGEGRADFQDLHFTSMIDKATPELMTACATGKHIGKATLHVRKAGGQQEEYLTITLTDVLVSSAVPGASNETGHMQFGLNYAAIKMDYKPQDAKGGLGAPVTFTYDLKQRTK